MSGQQADRRRSGPITVRLKSVTPPTVSTTVQSRIGVALIGRGLSGKLQSPTDGSSHSTSLGGQTSILMINLI